MSTSAPLMLLGELSFLQMSYLGEGGRGGGYMCVVLPG